MNKNKTRKLKFHNQQKRNYRLIFIMEKSFLAFNSFKTYFIILKAVLLRQKK